MRLRACERPSSDSVSCGTFDAGPVVKVWSTGECRGSVVNVSSNSRSSSVFNNRRLPLSLTGFVLIDAS